MRTSLVFLFCSYITLTFCGPLSYQYIIDKYYKHPAVAKFREYLQIDTSKEENIKYGVDFWARQARWLGLPFEVVYAGEKPVCVVTWQGSDPALPSIMLNTHMDVVTVDAEDWTYPPFEAHIDENGDIIARGAQDTKDVGIQYIEAISRLKKENVVPTRTIRITVMPDEETGGTQGMIPLLKSKVFKDWNVGFVLDEGLSSEDETLYATYQDKRPWQMKFTVHGTADHGFKLPADSSLMKLQRLMNVINAYRDQQRTLMNSGESYNVLNINVVHGGLATNIIPSKMWLVVDMRLTPSANVTEMENLVQSWVAAGGNGTELDWIRRHDESGLTSTDDSNPFWVALKTAVSDLGLTIEPILCPATSDLLPVRNIGIPALGFSAKIHTVSKMHGADEYLNVATFLKGIDIYTDVIRKLANVL